MPDFRRLILRKFNDIAGSRYEEILKEYREFFLTEEEMEIPVVSSILMTVDRFSEKPPEELYDIVTAYPGAFIRVVYLVDKGLCSLIRETLGEKAAREFKAREERLGEEFLGEIAKRLSELRLEFTTELIFEDKASFVEESLGEHDLLIISRHFGSESLKTHNVSPLAFRIIQRIEKPVIVY